MRAPSRVNATLVPRLITGLIILLVWELVVRAFAPAYVAKPTTVVLAIPRVIVDPAFLSATGSTLLAVAEGLAIALVAGTFIGLLMGRSPVAERSLRHYVNGFYAMPMIVVLPLFSLWFGYSGATRIATIIFAAIFSIVINVADGARSVPREYIEVARSFRGGKLRGLIEIVLPSSMPYLLAGLRLAGGRALIGAVVAEFFVSVGGLGMYILYNSRSYHHNEAFVGVIFLAAFGLSFELLINWMHAALHALVPPRRADRLIFRASSLGEPFMTSDPRLTAAISHWGARFVANGVTLTDFEEVTRSLSSYDDWCRAWSARAAIHEQMGREQLDARHFLTAGEASAARRRLLSLRLVFVRARHPADESRAQEADRMPAGRAAAFAAAGRARRNTRIKENSSPESCASLRESNGRRSWSWPSGCDSTKEETEAYEAPFLARGIATLVFEGPGQGEAQYDFAIRGDYEVPVAGGARFRRNAPRSRHRAYRHVGRQPWRLLRAARRGVRQAHQGLHRARRSV